MAKKGTGPIVTGAIVGRRSDRRAFTLIELVTALTIVAMIGGVSLMVLRSTTGARERVDHQSALQQEARAAISAIANALANANRPRKDDDIVLEGTPQRTGAAPADRIRFATVSHQSIRPDQPESDVHEVEFLLASPQERQMPALMRRTNPVRNEPPKAGGVIERVADDVVALAFEYFDGTRWADTWPESRHEWPVAIRVTLAVIDPQDPTKLIQATRLIDFPRRPQKQNGPQETKEVQQAHDSDQNSGGGQPAPGGPQQ